MSDAPAGPLDLIIAQATALRAQAQALLLSIEAVIVTTDAMIARPVGAEGANAVPFLMGPGAPTLTPSASTPVPEGSGRPASVVTATAGLAKFRTFDDPPPAVAPGPTAPGRDIAADSSGDLRPISDEAP